MDLYSCNIIEVQEFGLIIQSCREMKLLPDITNLKAMKAQLVSELRNGDADTKSYTDDSEIVRDTEEDQATSTLSAGDNDDNEIDRENTEGRTLRTKITKLKFKQAAERVRAERRKTKESKEHTSHIPTPRTSILKQPRTSKIPPPTTKPTVTKRGIKPTTVGTKPDDDFDKIYEEIVEHTDVSGDLTDPEKIDTEFEEIIHAYDKNKAQIPVPKVRQSKIPSLRHKSDHEIEGQKSSARFTEKSKVRSIPRLKEISMRAKEDNNDVSQVIRQHTKAVKTEKNYTNSNLEQKKLTDGNKKKYFVKTNKSAKTLIPESFCESDKLLSEEPKVIDDTKSEATTTINKFTKTVNTDIANDNDSERVIAYGQPIDDKENRTVITRNGVTNTIETQELSEKDNLNEENIDITDNKNIGESSQLTTIVSTEKMADDLDTSSIITINRSVSTESKHDVSLLQIENIEKTVVKVGIPVFDMQISESPIEKNTQILYTNKDIGRFDPEDDISDRDKTTYESFIGDKVNESDTVPTSSQETYTIADLNNNDEREIESTNNASMKEVYLTDINNSYEVKLDGPLEITRTVTIKRLISNPNATSNNVEQRQEIEDIKMVNIERDIEVSQPESILTFETVHSKDSTDVEKDEDIITTTEKGNTEDDIVEIRGKVGRLINRIGTKKSTLTDVSRKELDEELPKKKSILSKIALFERQDINEPMPKRKPRPEKLHINKIIEEKTVHIHTPKIVEEVLKPIQPSAETKDLDAETSSPHDPFLTYKPLYEHYKSAEINKPIEPLDIKVETIKTLEVKTPTLQAPLSPVQTTIDSDRTDNKLGNTSSIMVDAPVILVSPKINFTKNINLNTDENTAEFAKTIFSVKETKNIEVLQPVHINVNSEDSKIEVDSPKSSITSSITEVNNFKDVKKNIAMYENFGNLSKTVHKDKKTNVKDYTVDTKLDKDRANFEIKLKNVPSHDKTKFINETINTKEDVKFENVTPRNNVLTAEEITYEHIKPINRIVTPSEEIDDTIKSIHQTMTTAEDSEYVQIRPTNITPKLRDDLKYAKVRPISEGSPTKTEVLFENVRPISQIITTRDENIYETTRPVGQSLTVSEDFTPGNSRHKRDVTKDENWFFNRSTSSSYNAGIDQAGINNGRYRENKSKTGDGDMRKVKSVAEIDLGDAVKGKVNDMILRMKSVERFDLDKKEIINIREMPRMLSVSEKIALFERKVPPARSDSVLISCRSKSVRTLPTMQLSDEEFQQKLEELQSAKRKYGRWERMPSVVLSNGAKMPVLAVGTALLDTRLTRHVVSTAIDLGYRAIDCAYVYGNEKEIGDAVREKIADGTVRREDLFITSKLWSTFHRRDLVEKACRASLDAMGISYFDLYLIHNPMSFKEGDDPIPKIATVLQYSQHDYLDAWYGMEDLVSRGLVKNIGVSNFNSVQIQRILDKGKIKPVVNQVECHPYLSQQRLNSFCAQRNITLSCYGVLGSKGTPVEYKSGQSPVIDDPLVQVMASGLNMTPAQLLIRYQIEAGRNVIVKTSTGSRLWDNLQALDYTLTPGQVDALHALNRNKRNYTFAGMGDTHKNYPFKIAF